MDYLKNVQNLADKIHEFWIEEKKKEKWKAKINDWILSNPELFKSTFEKLLAKHSDEWERACYKKGKQPHCNNVLQALVECALEYGTEINCRSMFPKNELIQRFPSYGNCYNNYYFIITHGQGSVLTIYDSEMKQIFNL